MENDEKKQRIADVLAHIMSGEYARAKKEPVEEDVEPDPSYRVRENKERSDKALEEFLSGRMFEKPEE